MDLTKIREIIRSYKRHFDVINNEESYKWRAVKHFQDNWDINSNNFVEMLTRSLARTQNLLTSGQYFPRRMMIHYAHMDSQSVRQLFINLYKENDGKTLTERWEDFHQAAENLNKAFFRPHKIKNSFQDHRAFMGYLALKYPGKYYLYKFKMFKDFVEKVNYSHRPIKGRIENLLVYLELCEILRHEILDDGELLEMHRSRIKNDFYDDSNLTILTQDIIYATASHFERLKEFSLEQTPSYRLVRKDTLLLPNLKKKPPLINKSVTDTDYIEKQSANNKLGRRGELLVLAYEREKLRKAGSLKEPHHIALENDNAGFDILSYDENDEEIYIEVKTTSGPCDAAFFVSANELRKSQTAGMKFKLYRVYNYNEKTDSAFFCEIHGQLDEFCTEPVSYKVSVISDESSQFSKSE